ncbi:hypothetical protein [Spirochaeta africana]|uniref:Uncharacterized protein n=1 Tax=Spirochaeta africana (strain ATCC 700263 / DSM 8902 / Z-7692) TaxID=889378 RepID=H9UHT3_SPIAZ|nr:hypothetical protein [Spirochaeta africana]AFG37076.1 hypothetical protein Spiaf_0988 [Spirochaeta africana DSM 8902]
MRSINPKHLVRVGMDVYGQYLIWTAWAVGVLIVGFLLALPFFAPLRSLEVSALALLNEPAHIYLMIIGIITGVYVMPYFTRQGVTRHSYFWGNLLAVLALAVTIQLIGGGLQLIALLAEAITPFQAGRELTVYLGQNLGLARTIGISILVHTARFLMGWIIGFAFYRFRGFGGFLSIVSTLIIFAVMSILWEEGGVISIHGVPLVLQLDLSLGTAVLLTLGLLVLQTTALFLMIRRTPIKVQ